ncbi:MAG TPA: type VI secretion system accessory protein TagJ [Verrucomicrobiae bacterium]|nr:type VI secretion system accessory protein TagJ [Verrucomicrobiae bacterium]
MTAREYYQAGKLAEAIQALGADLRNDPADSKKRIFLFELLCFAGEYDRAEKHLEVLGQSGPDAATGALLYRAALAAERSRRDLFEKKEYPGPPAHDVEVRGTCNGKPFESFVDADPRIGPRIEMFAAGQYMWLPLAHVASIEIQAPKRLRDLLWAPALVRTGKAFKGQELGEVLMPVLSPFSFRHADDAVRLGRSTVWEAEADGVFPYGQKMFEVDGEDLPILELRKLEIAQPEDAEEEHAAGESSSAAQ